MLSNKQDKVQMQTIMGQIEGKLDHSSRRRQKQSTERFLNLEKRVGHSFTHWIANPDNDCKHRVIFARQENPHKIKKRAYRLVLKIQLLLLGNLWTPTGLSI
jgi:hypothetical protein